MVSRPTCTAVSASISTPVRPTVSAMTSQAMRLAASSMLKSTVTRVSGIGWHSGISSAVRLAPWIAAMRAMPITSPFLLLPASTIARVSGFMLIMPAARAIRRVSVLVPTSTIWAFPSASKCVKESLIVNSDGADC